MMTDEEKELLRFNGWMLECESPLEISHADGCTATGLAANIVITYLHTLAEDDEWEDDVDDEDEEGDSDSKSSRPASTCDDSRTVAQVRTMTAS